VVALSYIAAQRVFPDYGDMADAKALLESIGRSWGYRLGKCQTHPREHREPEPHA
jgi:enoyl-[acyl-carrier protein] reductase I